MQTGLSIEQFVPKLHPDIELTKTPAGDPCLFFPSQHYYCLDEFETNLFNCIDGEKNLTQIALATAGSNSALSVRSLVQLIQSLAQYGGLENSAIQLKNYGLLSDSKGRYSNLFLRPLLGPTISARILGKLLTSILTPIARSGITLQFLLLVGALLTIVISAMNFDFHANRSLALHGNYITGFIALYSGAVLACTGRQFMRAWILASKKAPCHAAGIGLRCFVLTPTVDTRHITLAGQTGETELALGGITGLSIPVAILMGIVSHGGAFFGFSAEFLAIAMFGGVLTLLLSLCPYGQTDSEWLNSRVLLGESPISGPITSADQRYFQLLMNSNLLKPRNAKRVFLFLATVWFLSSFGFVVWLNTDLILPACAQLMNEDAPIFRLLLVLFVLVTTFAPIVLWRAIFRKNAPRANEEIEVGMIDLSNVQNAVGTNPLFTFLDHKAKNALAKATESIQFQAGQNIVTQGEQGDTYYIIAKGDVDVVITLPDGSEKVVAGLHSGDSFGEIALIKDTERTATVRATNSVHVFGVQRATFLISVQEAGISPEMVTNFLRAASALHKAPMFRDLAVSTLNNILTQCKRHTAASGEVIIKEGEEGQLFYIIENGEVVITKESVEGPIAHLRTGDFFGEIALLSDTPRTATVTATQESKLLTLDREGFHQLIAREFVTAFQLESLAKERRS